MRLTRPMRTTAKVRPIRHPKCQLKKHFLPLSPPISRKGRAGWKAKANKQTSGPKRNGRQWSTVSGGQE